MTSRTRSTRRRAQGASKAVPAGRYETLFSFAKEFISVHSGTLRLAGLAGILLLSFWSGMSLHWDYPYPLHVDEWFAIGYAQSTIDAGALQYPHPYRPSEISYHPEMGFQLLLGFLKTTTGLSWMDLYRFAPGVMVAGLAFVAYAFGRRAGFGWAAALFVSLIPTSVRVLGPSFVVPVTAAMLFIPVTLLVLHNMGEKNRQKSLWILTLLMAGAVFFHPPTGVAITGLVVLYLIGFVGEAWGNKQYREGLKLLLATAVRISVPVLILGLWLPSLTQDALEKFKIGAVGSVSSNDSVAVSSIGTEIVSSDIVDTASLLGFQAGFTGAFGILAVVVFALGLFVFIARGDFGVRTYMLTVFTGLLIAFLVFIYPTYQLGPDILYRRGWLYLGLLMAIFAGYGVGIYFRSIPAIVRTASSWIRRPLGAWPAVALWTAGAAVVVAAVITGLITNESRDAYSNVYHVVNEEVSTDFRWIGRHATPEQTVAMGEPTIAWAYPPVAGPGTGVFEAVFDPWTTQTADTVREMLSLGEADVPWLKGAGISVFYSCLPISFACRELTNGDMFKVRRGVYLIPDLPDRR